MALKRFQHLRGVLAKKPTLDDGEIYVAKDTKQLVVGSTTGEFTIPNTSQVIPSSEKGTANGVATLDSSGKLTASQKPTGLVSTFGPINVTIPNSWSGSGPWTQTVSVSGLLSTDTLIGIYPNTSGMTGSTYNTYVKNFNCLSEADSQNGSMLLTCKSAKPTGAFTVVVKGVR